MFIRGKVRAAQMALRGCSPERVSVYNMESRVERIFCPGIFDAPYLMSGSRWVRWRD